ncbi:MAG: LacI family transcriptional regulator [Devosia sp.]|uniref:LacI family DNA-binding transcriptional regulator n=1 Tax=Devosia sp. TaxID=1871048 RepID=UPI00260BEDF2|nr:LacI family DNA-binding transcriptional regulator [Devosia sp.]MDB5585319.1 LacI family transcriptional regulator [Devosia sp.]
MRRRPTIRDVASASGVSMGTVSRVAAKSSVVSPETRHRVEQAMRTLGYVPNIAARTMRTNRTKIVGLLLPDLANTVFLLLAKAAERLLGAEGYTLFLYSSERSPTREIEFLELASRYRMDGLIVSLSDETNQSVVEALSKMECPIVLLDRDTPIRADVVFSEHAEAMQRVTAHLIELGHRRIALITAPLGIRPGRERVLGYRAALRDAGLGVDEALIGHDYQTSKYGFSKALEMLRRPVPPTAVIAGGDEIFYGVLRATRQLNLAIPGDVSIVGADNRMLSDVVTPMITIIDRDMEQVGDTAADMLIRRMNGEGGEPVHVHLPSEVILRSSTAKPRPDVV